MKDNKIWIIYADEWYEDRCDKMIVAIVDSLEKAKCVVSCGKARWYKEYVIE